MIAIEYSYKLGKLAQYKLGRLLQKQFHFTNNSPETVNKIKKYLTEKMKYSCLRICSVFKMLISDNTRKVMKVL